MIGANPEVHSAQHVAWDNGYREAILDVYCFLSGNIQVYDLDDAHLAMILEMVAQVDQRPNRLQPAD